MDGMGWMASNAGLDAKLDTRLLMQTNKLTVTNLGAMRVRQLTNQRPKRRVLVGVRSRQRDEHIGK